MTTSLIPATDEMIAVVEAAWAAVPAIVGGVAPLIINLRDPDKEPTAKVKAWGRLTLRHWDAVEYAHAKRYDNTGTLYLNVFVPKSTQSGTILQRVTGALCGALRAHGTSNGSVSFTRVRFNEAGVDGIWDQVNILSDFRYFERN